MLITLMFAAGFYFYDNYNAKPKVQAVSDSISTVNYLPTSTTGQIIYHQNYALSYHEKYEQAEWVAYELNANQLVSNKFKRPYFEQDPKVLTKSANYWNYKNSGYNKGHLCPAGDRIFSEEAYNETFLTSNIAPQIYEFNAGIWNRLEQKVRYWAQKYEKLYIVTGGILTSDLKTIGDENVAVPNYFYKIIVDFQEPEIKAIAFLIPHETSEKALYQYVVSIDEIEKLTGINFFAELPNDLENNLEKSDSYVNWSF
ncbi:DNA/RNA non-specific endonuclease [Flavobacterium sp.]|uniref:DNA/RNA non-specific endonuclease n=1 Tax=Flavobacterium sp. TaxID=239 RepID=UPI004047E513